MQNGIIVMEKNNSSTGFISASLIIIFFVFYISATKQSFLYSYTRVIDIQLNQVLRSLLVENDKELLFVKIYNSVVFSITLFFITMKSTLLFQIIKLSREITRNIK